MRCTWPLPWYHTRVRGIDQSVDGAVCFQKRESPCRKISKVHFCLYALEASGSLFKCHCIGGDAASLIACVLKFRSAGSSQSTTGTCRQQSSKHKVANFTMTMQVITSSNRWVKMEKRKSHVSNFHSTLSSFLSIPCKTYPHHRLPVRLLPLFPGSGSAE